MRELHTTIPGCLESLSKLLMQSQGRPAWTCTVHVQTMNQTRLMATWDKETKSPAQSRGDNRGKLLSNPVNITTYRRYSIESQPSLPPDFFVQP